MTENQYIPRPIDTSNVVISKELLALSESLAEHIHETWASARIMEGWIYGPIKDENMRTTPCLVEYSKLPESEKEYDRRTAFETIKFLLKLGYEIKKV